jgi:hypothetical protein
VRIIGQDELQRAARRHADVSKALTAVAPFTVFNIRGNKYRIIAVVNYWRRAVEVSHVLTHADYDEGNWK